MKRLPVSVVLNLLTLLSWGCLQDMGDPAGPGPTGGTHAIEGRYAYAGYDKAGAQFVRGVLLIELEDSTELKGRWELQATRIGSLDGFGPQFGSGRLEGELSGDTVSMGLNPNYVDNNVVLFGRWSASEIAGTWEFIGFPGVLNRGTFRAVLSRPD